MIGLLTACARRLCHRWFAAHVVEGPLSDSEEPLSNTGTLAQAHDHVRSAPYRLND